MSSEHDLHASTHEDVRLLVLASDPVVEADPAGGRVLVTHRGRRMEFAPLDAVLVSRALMEAARDVVVERAAG